MKISIKYCVPCGYLPRAEELKERLENSEFKVDVTLIKGERGVFDVTVEGELIFSKHKEGRFPEYAEIKAGIMSLFENRIKQGHSHKKPVS